MPDGKRARACDCEALLEELSAYLDGDLGRARCRALQRHLADCARCSALSARLQRTKELCRQAGGPALPAAVRREARARARALAGRMTGRSPRRKR